MSALIRHLGGLCLLMWAIWTPCSAQELSAITEHSARNQAPKWALVIGNGQYEGSHRDLKNPTHDARLISDTLGRLGFDVQMHLNLPRDQLARKIAAFATNLPTGATALVYYAGHGMQVGGSSYLMPVDIQVGSEQTLARWAYPLRRLLDELASARSAVNIVVLDACRDNPFQPPSPVRYRGGGPMGLAKVQVPRGSLVAYSTQPGQLALDGKGTHSVYTAALAQTLLEPGLTLEDVFKKVNTLVRKVTQDEQIPWYESSLTQAYFFLPPEGITVTAAPVLRVPSGLAGSSTRQYHARSETWTPGMSAHELGKLQSALEDMYDGLDGTALAQLHLQADAGDVLAMTLLGQLHLRGHPSLPAPDRAKALFWLQKAADLSFPIAQVELAGIYKTGIGTSPNLSLARQLLEKASAARYRRAEMELLELNIFGSSAAGGKP